MVPVSKCVREDEKDTRSGSGQVAGAVGPLTEAPRGPGSMIYRDEVCFLQKPQVLPREGR